jgi:hypothetical protein
VLDASVVEGVEEVGDVTSVEIGFEALVTELQLGLGA